mmetsp:Transcript_105856/g.199352  ORF Transcript_105856/g.199352 Transcript_105856/m.199352 type:complete len:223 (+) Transcript_105856:2400-3068(+)
MGICDLWLILCSIHGRHPRVHHRLCSGVCNLWLNIGRPSRADARPSRRSSCTQRSCHCSSSLFDRFLLRRPPLLLRNVSLRPLLGLCCLPHGLLEAGQNRLSPRIVRRSWRPCCTRHVCPIQAGRIGAIHLVQWQHGNHRRRPLALADGFSLRCLRWCLVARSASKGSSLVSHNRGGPRRRNTTVRHVVPHVRCPRLCSEAITLALTHHSGSHLLIGTTDAK